MYVITYTDENNLWNTVNTAWIKPETGKQIVEPLFFETFDDAINFALEQFDNGQFEIMGMCARGEVKQHVLEYLYNKDNESIIENYQP